MRTIRPGVFGVLLLASLSLAPWAAPAEAGDGMVPIGDDMADKKAEILLRAKVRRAIATGARWVASMQRPDGSFQLTEKDQPENPAGPHPFNNHRFGISALCFYTLADCGYGADTPEIRKAVGYLRKRYRSQMKNEYWRRASAYSLSIFVLGLHTLYAKPEQRDTSVEHDTYGRRKDTKKNPCDYPKWVRTTIHDILGWLLKSQASTGLFRYPGGLDQESGGRLPPGMPQSHLGPEDLSNTQYVLLALWAGSRCGFEIETATLKRITLRLLAYQDAEGPTRTRQPDPAPVERPKGGTRYAKPDAPTPQQPEDRERGFVYTLGAETTGSMTTAGISSLAIVKAMLMERNALDAALRKKIDRGLWDGIAWMAGNYTLTRNPGAMGRMWQYYYLYGLERAFVILGKRFIGERDWYREGARMLVKAQEEDGRWQPEGQLGMFGGAGRGGPRFRTDLLDTCFALLFLKRATITPKRPVLDGPVTTPASK